MTGVPPRGLAYISTTEGFISIPTPRARAAWSISAKIAMPAPVMAFNKRSKVAWKGNALRCSTGSIDAGLFKFASCHLVYSTEQRLCAKIWEMGCKWICN
jgi:hypothetical protein